MKNLILAFIFSISVYASQTAVTDTGDVIILNDNGTWKYKDRVDATSISINSHKFVTPKSSTFLLKSQKNSSAFWINAKKWRFVKGPTEGATEYNFELKSQDLYGMAITEGLDIPLESLGEIAFENASSAAPNAKLLEKEYRTVNNQKILYMKFSGTIQGIDFTYIG